MRWLLVTRSQLWTPRKQCISQLWSIRQAIEKCLSAHGFGLLGSRLLGAFGCRAHAYRTAHRGGNDLHTGESLSRLLPSDFTLKQIDPSKS